MVRKAESVMHGRAVMVGFLVVVAGVVFAVPAFDDTAPLYPSPPSPVVAAPQSLAPQAAAPQPAAAPLPAAQAAPSAQPVAQVKSGGLPVTGGDVVGLSIIGLVAIAGGLVLMRFRGARRSSLT
jgi:hypothetical protein